MIESLNAPMMMALCRYRGILKGRTSERSKAEDLGKLGAVFDHAEGDEFLEGLIHWLLKLALEDLEKAAENHYSRK